MLTFESFDLESHSDCDYDFVQISAGSVEMKLCGSDKPSPVMSSGNTMDVTFHTDHSVKRNGFKATWAAVENSGRLFPLLVNQIIHNIGVIQSPNYPAKYPRNVNEVISAYNYQYSLHYIVRLGTLRSSLDIRSS